jgi:arylsulfatase A-like enzyme
MSDNSKKNVVIILVDAFRPKNLSMFGYQKETDRNLKEIAKEGIVFKNFFPGSNSTAPSLMSIFTGKLPKNHGIIHQFPYTSEEEVGRMYAERTFWLPSFLKEKGYKTTAIDWIGMFFEEGFDFYKEREEWQGENKVPTHFSPAKDTTDLAISRMKEGGPFFLFLHLWDTHFPFLTTEFSSEKKDIEEVLKEVEGDVQKEYYRRKVQVKGNEIYSLKSMVDKYDASITEVDKQIGKICQYLKSEGLWENTIFMVLGDHGTNLTEHNIYFSSSSLFDDAIHAPFIASFPGFRKAEVEGFVQDMDIAPTILELIGEKSNEEWKFDGKSMTSLIKNKEEIRDKVLFYDGLEEDVRGVRTKDRKVIFAKSPKCHLCKGGHHKEWEEYDLISDPEEKNNIYSKVGPLAEKII